MRFVGWRQLDVRAPRTVTCSQHVGIAERVGLAVGVRVGRWRCVARRVRFSRSVGAGGDIRFACAITRCLGDSGDRLTGRVGIGFCIRFACGVSLGFCIRFACGVSLRWCVGFARAALGSPDRQRDQC